MGISLRNPNRYKPQMGDRVVIKQVADKSMRDLLGRTGQITGFNGVYVVMVQFDGSEETFTELHAQDALVEKIEDND